MEAAVWPRSLPDCHCHQQGRSPKLLPREIVYDIWISDPLTGGRAWLAQVTSEALACSMAAEIETGRLPVELRRIADGWSALWSGAVSSPQLAEPGRGSC